MWFLLLETPKHHSLNHICKPVTLVTIMFKCLFIAAENHTHMHTHLMLYGGFPNEALWLEGPKSYLLCLLLHVSSSSCNNDTAMHSTCVELQKILFLITAITNAGLFGNRLMPSCGTSTYTHQANIQSKVKAHS